MKSLAVLVVSIAVNVACIGGGQLGRPSNASPIPGISPDGYYGIAWLKDGTIVVAIEEEPGADEFVMTVWRLDPDGSDFEPLALDAGRDCDVTSHSAPTALADGRLGALEACEVGDDPNLAIVAFDLTSLEREQLSEVDLAPSWFAWNVALERGMLESGSGLCQSLAWATPDGLEPAEIMVEHGDREFRLDEAFEPDGECDGGRANWPTWSPDGDEIAFVASPQSIGVTGQRRLDVPWNLYVVGADETVARRVGDFEILHPRGLTWSPDGAWLAVAGELVGQGEGTWLVRFETAAVTRVSSRAMDWLAWSPDSDQLAAIFDPDPSQSPPAFELLRIDVSTVVSRAAPIQSQQDHRAPTGHATAV